MTNRKQALIDHARNDMKIEANTKPDYTKLSGVNFCFARPLGSGGDWERVIDSDFPCCMETGKRLGPEDVFKLEYSGWTMHVEFKPKIGSLSATQQQSA